MNEPISLSFSSLENLLSFVGQARADDYQRIRLQLNDSRWISLAEVRKHVAGLFDAPA